MMRRAWVKSLHCKSNAVDDVVYPPPPPPSSSSSRKHLLSTASCANSSSAVKGAVFVFPKYPSSSSSLPKKPTRLRQKPKPSSYLSPSSSPAVDRAVEAAARRTVGFPTLSELPEGHSSRRVVELIFLSSWSSSSSAAAAAAAFPGEIEMLFRVHNPARTLARFEDRRAAARARAAAANDARCAVDGNEMMRFHYSAAGRCGNVYDAGVSWSERGELKGVRTFSGSGGAHACGGGSAGRSAMLVCRVIAGRVMCEYSSEADSVSLGNDELVVLDPWAVLPCFLIIYKI